MATRRPKVPRATPAASEAESVAADGGGDVIEADFGGAPAPGTNHEVQSPPPASGNPKPGKRGAGKSASGKTTSRRPGNGLPGRNGTAKTAAGGDTAGENLEPVPAKAFSGRLLALGVVMIAITILLAPTVKIFVDKRAEIAALEADIADKQATRDDLKREVSRWQDPNYVKQQARNRINMVMPGETGYWVFGSDLPATESGSAAAAATAQDPANLPWVDTLWESIRRSATD
ncbi:MULTISPECIES: septum formation initiator family protein [Arthrobacter]|uniref:Septum formation initiator family protein n=1 Tax=Arthrobacter oryzae TaxID=409290 RepID=A0A3N0C6V7_9MICC|nr:MULTISPECIES: septum formation initiator family protein [Arthrobacter]QYF90969.1 septum formation initiator family protein [Arthrobacter sp. PAMC25284]RNL58083.1 septum formation initiator family protein [Arthrobacter oryzae]